MVKRKKGNSFIRNQKALNVAKPAPEVDVTTTETKRSRNGQSLSRDTSVIDPVLTERYRNAIKDVKRSLLCGGVILAILIGLYIFLR